MSQEIETSAKKRGITRLCHFTPSRNLLHIAAGKVGILSTSALENDERAAYNPTDIERLDGKKTHICCSIEFPNAWYFDKARTQDSIFPDWAVLLVDPKYLWKSGTLFSPRNAAAEYGRYIAEGTNAFEALFADQIVGTARRVFNRGPKHSIACPTDQQAEVLIPDCISISDIRAVAVADENQGLTERARLKANGLDPDMFNFVVAPHMFKKYTLDDIIRNGKQAAEPSLSLPTRAVGT